jgi:hypothetical protein
MALCKVGHVYIVKTVLARPPKAKFAVCVCIDPEYFVWINTNARYDGHDQVVLGAGCHDLIVHDSHLDLSRVIVHSTQELEDAREFSCISPDLCALIINRIDEGLHLLPRRQAQHIRDSLSKLYH